VGETIEKVEEIREERRERENCPCNVYKEVDWRSGEEERKP